MTAAAATTADVNWLLSALAQATAALIAIVGGLLVSRYVALHAEQEAAQRRLTEVERRHRDAETDLTEAQAVLDAYMVQDLLDDAEVFKEIEARGFSATPDDVLAALGRDSRDLNAVMLAARVAELNAELAEAYTALSRAVPRGRDQRDWVQVKREHDFDVKHEGAWAWVYEKVREQREDEAFRAEQAVRSGMRFPVGPDNPAIAQLARRQSARLLRGSTVQYDVAHSTALRTRVADADALVRALRQEARLAKETYDATRQPEGFSLALQVLSVLAALGLAFPVVLMGFGPMTLPPSLRIAVIVVFFAGVALLLRFLFVYATFLREGGRSTLPRNAWNLLAPGGRATSTKQETSS